MHRPTTDPADRPSGMASDPPAGASRAAGPAANGGDAGWLSAPVVLVQALLFGLIFGFLLQKGGVAKFDILIGVLLLENFVVIKVMVSAIIVGMVGVYVLERAGVLERQLNETEYGKNVLGGLIFGAGFALIAYCPGTGAAALGQGNLDAIPGIIGLIAGSYAYAMCSRGIDRTVGTWGRRGKLSVNDAVRMPRGAVVAIAVPLLVVALLLIEWLDG